MFYIFNMADGEGEKTIATSVEQFKSLPRGKQTIIDKDGHAFEIYSDGAGKVRLVDSNGNGMTINSMGQLHVVLMGDVDDGNSTATPLAGDAVFTGTAFNTLDFGFIFLTVFSDVPSATDGLSVQQSSDGINWDNTDEFSIPAGIGKTYSIQPAAKWFRIIYTNGSSEQTDFRLQTIFKKTSSLPSSHRLSNNLSPEDDASLVIGIIKGQKPDGDYVDFNATAGGNFKISMEEYDAAFTSNPLPVRDPFVGIARGLVTGMKSVNKFGRNIEIDSDVLADVWDGGYTLASGGVSLVWVAPTQARIHAIVSSSDADSETGGTNPQGAGARTMRVWGLTSWSTAETFEDIVMDGTNSVNTISSYVIINRMQVLTKGATEGANVGVIKATAVTDNTITAQIRVGQGQTQMAIYGIPDTKKAYIGRIYGNINKAGGGAGLADVHLCVNSEPNSELIGFIVKHTFGLQTVGTSAITITYYTPKVIEGPAIIKMVVESGSDNMDASAGFDFVLIDN